MHFRIAQQSIFLGPLAILLGVATAGCADDGSAGNDGGTGGGAAAGADPGAAGANPGGGGSEPGTEGTPPLRLLDALPCGSLDHADVARLAPTMIATVLRTASNTLAFADTSELFPLALSGQDATWPDAVERDSVIGDLTAVLQHVLVLGNLESTSDSTVTYLLNPDVTCTDAPDALGEPSDCHERLRRSNGMRALK